MAVSFYTNDTRLPALVQRVGDSASVYETFVMRLATALTREVPDSEIRRYRGGCWCLEEVSLPEFGTVFWWRLESDEQFQCCNSLNGSDELVDAELLSMVACLMAATDLCSSYHHRAIDSEKAAVRDPRFIEHLERLAESYHDFVHGLRGYFFDRLENDSVRKGKLFRLID